MFSCIVPECSVPAVRDRAKHGNAAAAQDCADGGPALPGLCLLLDSVRRARLRRHPGRVQPGPWHRHCHPSPVRQVIRSLELSHPCRHEPHGEHSISLLLDYNNFLQNYMWGSPSLYAKHVMSQLTNGLFWNFICCDRSPLRIRITPAKQHSLSHTRLMRIWFLFCVSLTS